jgi:hypothetical protein
VRGTRYANRGRQPRVTKRYAEEAQFVAHETHSQAHLGVTDTIEHRSCQLASTRNASSKIHW